MRLRDKNGAADKALMTAWQVVSLPCKMVMLYPCGSHHAEFGDNLAQTLPRHERIRAVEEEDHILCRVVLKRVILKPCHSA